MQQQSDKVAAVTGATGFIGSHLCHNLLEHGYTVRACVRQDIPSKTAHLRDMVKTDTAGKLEIRVADMMDHGAYDDIFPGCSVIFHVAGNFGTDKRWRANVYQPGRRPPAEQALEELGTTDTGTNKKRKSNFCPSYDHAVYESYVLPLKCLLLSVEKCTSVRRIIYTSSGAAGGTVLTAAAEEEESGGFDLNQAIRDDAYGRAKKDCERLLYEFGERNKNIVCASSCPCIVLGPLLAVPLHDTVYQHRMGDMLRGRYVLKHEEWDIVDARDVAETQRLMAERESLVNGTRFWNGSQPSWEVPEILRFIQKEYKEDEERIQITLPSNYTNEEQASSDDHTEDNGDGSGSDEEQASSDDHTEDNDDESGSDEEQASSDDHTDDNDDDTSSDDVDDDDSFGESEWDTMGRTTWSDPVSGLGLKPRNPKTTVLDTVKSLLQTNVLDRPTLSFQELCDYYTVAEMDGCEEEMEWLLSQLQGASDP